MCGIAGMFDRRQRRDFDAGLLARMNDTLTHRGPDDGGLHLEPGVALAHRRLSIIDLAGGHQPFATADGQIIVVFNGEIYNFMELRDELITRGHSFRSRSDTEVILYAWAEWGPACVERFRGMFAFALWDRRQRLLFLARDRLGIKPLYWTELADGRVLFGSELKALLAHPELPRQIDPLAVEEYLALGYVPEPRSIYQGVHKLEPGHRMLVREGVTPLASESFWYVRFDARETASEPELHEELVERLAEAVRVRLVADVPLGAFLSGGVDSSAVVALMARARGDDPVQTCSIAFNVAGFDETRFARQVAERYHTDHHVETVDSDDFDLLDQLAGLYDEPYADSSAIPTYRVCELARRHVTVALSGDGGDELFAGYRRYRWHMFEERFRRVVPAALRGPLFGLAARIYPKMDWAPRPLRAKATLQGIARESLAGYLHGVSVIPDALRETLYSASLRAALDGYRAIEVFRRHAQAADTDDPLSLIQYVDLKTYLPGDILTKVDRASMAHALEVRVPVLDHPFVEWTATLPSALKLHAGKGKWLFKRALEPLLPNDVLYRPKQGFAVPLARWFRGPLRERLRAALAPERVAAAGFFDPIAVQRIVDQHVSGLRDHAAVLWSLLMFDAFLRREGL